MGRKLQVLLHVGLTSALCLTALVSPVKTTVDVPCPMIGSVDVTIDHTSGNPLAGVGLALTPGGTDTISIVVASQAGTVKINDPGTGQTVKITPSGTTWAMARGSESFSVMCCR